MQMSVIPATSQKCPRPAGASGIDLESAAIKIQRAIRSKQQQVQCQECSDNRIMRSPSSHEIIINIGDAQPLEAQQNVRLEAQQNSQAPAIDNARQARLVAYVCTAKVVVGAVTLVFVPLVALRASQLLVNYLAKALDDQESATRSSVASSAPR